MQVRNLSNTGRDIAFLLIKLWKCKRLQKGKMDIISLKIQMYYHPYFLYKYLGPINSSFFELLEIVFSSLPQVATYHITLCSIPNTRKKKGISRIYVITPISPKTFSPSKHWKKKIQNQSFIASWMLHFFSIFTS